MPKRRFIAGAECPSCKALDTVFVYLDSRLPTFECAKCGHKEVLVPSETVDEKQANVDVVKIIEP